MYCLSSATNITLPKRHIDVKTVIVIVNLTLSSISNTALNIIIEIVNNAIINTKIGNPVNNFSQSGKYDINSIIGDLPSPP